MLLVHVKKEVDTEKRKSQTSVGAEKKRERNDKDIKKTVNEKKSEKSVSTTSSKLKKGNVPNDTLLESKDFNSSKYIFRWSKTNILYRMCILWLETLSNHKVYNK